MADHEPLTITTNGLSMQIYQHGLPSGIELIEGDDLKTWKFDIRVLDNNPLYQNQIYRLKFLFPDAYPIGSCPTLQEARRYWILTDISNYRAARGYVRKASGPSDSHASSHLL